ncbi:hypothetical protein HPB50_008089 [Hyalomma asiaticum]|uniref:Uncharacterized protein n=1 Tax=Hyalomma asiaticum TaxID=266040 RepID=A0ACB7RVE0_HYAAI|nr:hypothetical protein HPB50_008089 [Hyalomma asiaticum]
MLKRGLNTHLGRVLWEHVSTMWNLDNNCITLKVAPKLSRSHIFPNGFDKMRVDLAFHIFSKEAQHAISFYKMDIERHYPNVEPTRAFIDLMARLIEAMTSRFPGEAMRCLSFYSLARSPKDGNVSSDVLESLLSLEEVLTEEGSQSQDDVTALPTDAVQVAVDHESYVEPHSGARESGPDSKVVSGPRGDSSDLDNARHRGGRGNGCESRGAGRRRLDHRGVLLSGRGPEDWNTAPR